MIGIKYSADGKLEVECSDQKNVREFKGTSANKHVDDYCIVDLETTDRNIYFADIIEISALRVRDNKVVSEYSTLVNPMCHIPSDATKVNHITDDMVKNSPTLSEVIDDFLDFVGDDVIVGYNNTSYDMNIIYDQVEELKNKYFTNDYLDLMYAIKRSLKDLENSKLETVSKHYGLDTTGEHRALKDCYLTKECYDKLYEEFGENAFISSKHSSSSTPKKLTPETIALQELSVLLKDVLSDGKVTDNEVYFINDWRKNHSQLSKTYPFDKVFKALENVLEDGIITEQELIDLKAVFEEIVDPVKNQSEHKQIDTLKDKHICLTGDFNYGSKANVEKLIGDAGGIIDKSVKKATNYVVVGSQGSQSWKTGNYGSKIQKAMENKEKGQDIEIIEENEFIPAVENIINK